MSDQSQPSWLELDGTALAYDVSGSGPPIVLVHGLALDGRMWDDQVDALSDVATVIRYDLRGFGRSARTSDADYTHADDLFGLLDHLGHRSAVLVGLSMGGRVVLEATLESPERVDALVLLDAVLDGVPWDDESSAGMKAISAGLRAGGLAGAKAAWLRHGFFGPAQRRPEVSRRLAEMVADYPGGHWTGADPHGPHPDCIDRLATVTVPTTVVVGELDVPCFHTMAEVLATGIPGARMVVVPDAGHMVNMEAPAVVNEILREVVTALTDATA